MEIGAESMNLPKLLAVTGANCAVISTPERCPRPGSSGAPYDFECMFALENLAKDLHPKFICGYDFAGSSSGAECAKFAPDKSMQPHQWSEKSDIRKTHWARYWSGCVRGTMKSMLMLANGIEDKNSMEMLGTTWATPGSKIVIVFSITGGPITQVEKSLIPQLISGTLSDLSTRNIDSEGMKHILWIHFDNFECLAKALVGHGEVKYFDYMNGAQHFGDPMVWEDGPLNDDGGFFDRFNSLAKLSQTDRLNYILNPTTNKTLSEKLAKAMDAHDFRLVRSLLAKGADPNVELEWTRGDGEVFPFAPIVYAYEMSCNPLVVKEVLLAKANVDDNIIARAERLQYTDWAKSDCYNVHFETIMALLRARRNAEDVASIYVSIDAQEPEPDAPPSAFGLFLSRCLTCFSPMKSKGMDTE